MTHNISYRGPCALLLKMLLMLLLLLELELIGYFNGTFDRETYRLCEAIQRLCDEFLECGLWWTAEQAAKQTAFAHWQEVD